MLYSFRDKKPEIGKDTYISDQAIIIGDVKISDSCYIGPGAILRGDYCSIVIKSSSAIEEGVIVHSPPDKTCIIGEKVTIGHGAIVHCKSIGNNVAIGMGAILSIDSEIGENTIIAEGTLLKMRQKVHPGMMVGGNPAKELRKITDEDKKTWSQAKQLYVDLAKEYLQGGIKKL